nr:carboxypeptidase B-like [Onthophagus taurus]
MHIIFTTILIITVLNPLIITQDLSKRVSYKGYQLWKLKADTKEKKDAIKNLDIVEITRWSVNKSSPDVLISADNLEKVKNDLERYEISHRVLIKDVQGIIDEQPIEDAEEMKFSHKIETFNLSEYHNFPVIINYLTILTKVHNHIKLTTIGKTIQNNPIDVVTISGGGKNGIFIEAGLHAREWISPASIIFVISTFANDFNKESGAIKKLDWHFLPIGNPDGYIYSYTKDRLWRKNRSRWGNCFGTDLNRNFGYQWDYGDPNPCEETFSGTEGFSEHETVAIRDYIKKFDPHYWKAYVSIHSYGQYVLYPYGFSKTMPGNINELKMISQNVIKAIKEPYKTIYTSSAVSDLYIAAGVSTDWAKSIGIQYSFAFELRDQGKYAFLLPAQYIIPTGEELLNGIRVIAESALNDISKKSVGRN